MKIKKLLFGIVFVFCLVLTIKGATAEINDSVTGYYALNETSGLAVDSSGHLTALNSGCTAGRIGKINNSYICNVTGYVINTSTDMGLIDSGGGMRNLSITAWVKLNAEIGTGSYMLVDVADTSTKREAFLLYQYNGGARKLCAEFDRMNVGGEITCFPLTMGTTEWHFLTLTISPNNLSIWYNGTWKNSSALTTTNGTGSSYEGLFIGKRGDGVGQSNALFDEVGFFNISLSGTNISYLYNSGVGLTYPFFNATTPSPPAVANVTFVSQTPTNLTSTNGFPLTAKYNFTNTTGINNTYINYTIATALTRCIETLNGSCVENSNSFQQQYNTTGFSGNNQSFNLNDNQIYPENYNFNEDSMRTTTHSSLVSSNQNDVWTIGFVNVSNSSNYGFFEVMANSTSPRPIFYCNSSYISGNPTSDANCVQFATLNTITYNHTHSVNEAHQVFSLPINITSGKIGNVQVTSNSTIKIKGTNIGVMQIYYINNFSRDGASQTSINLGVTNTNQIYTFDSHLHQYVGDERLNYTACQNKSGVIECDVTIQSDIIDDSFLPPSSPNIINPSNLSQVVNEFLNISYSASSTGSSLVSISYYNITLLNSDLSHNLTIMGNNSNNLSYNWNTYLSNLEIGIYHIKVEATDSLGQKSYSISQPINITTNSKLNISLIEYSTNISISTFTINLTDIISGEIKTQTTTINVTSFDVIKNRLYNASIDANGYAPGYQIINNTLNQSSFIYDSGVRTTTSASFIGLLTYNLVNYTNANVTSYTNNMHSSGGLHSQCYVNFTYTDGSFGVSSTFDTTNSGYTAHTYDNPNTNKFVSQTRLFCNSAGTCSEKDDLINFTFESNYNNKTLTIYNQNSININIYDEVTMLKLSGTNITVQFIKDTSSTYTTTTGELYIYNLTDGIWTIRFSGTNYTTKTYTLTVSDRSHQNLDAYLSSSAYLVVFGVTSSATNLPVEDASFTMEKLIGASYVIIENKYTDILGKAQFSYVPYTKYKFTIAKSGFLTKIFYLDPVIYSTYEISLVQVSSQPSVTDYDQVSVVFYPKTFDNNAVNNFTFLISSPTGTLVNYAYTIKYPGGSNTSTGILSTGETLQTIFTITNATLFSTVNLSFNYTSTLNGFKQFSGQYAITGDSIGGNNTIDNLRNNHYGMGLLERAFLVMIVIVIGAGFAYGLAGIGGSLLIGLIIMGIAVYLGFLPIASIVISLLLGMVILVSSGIGGNK